MDSLYLGRGQEFFRSEDSRNEPPIIAALVGGSRIHREPESEGQISSDWEGAFLLARKVDVFHLVNNRRQALAEMLDITHEECPYLRVPEPSSEIWDKFDAVRFAGFTSAGTKKSVQILSQEYFSGSKTAINILSFKDQRVFRSSTTRAMKRYLIHQATQLDNGLCILHDQWVFKADPEPCAHGNDIGLTAFGVTADLLLSGVWMLRGATCGQLVQKWLLQQFSSASNRHASVESLARFHEFDPVHRQWLGSRLAALNASIVLPVHCGCAPSNAAVIYGSTINVNCKNLRQRFPRIRQLPPIDMLPCHAKQSPSDSINVASMFSSNSTSCSITMPASSADTSTIKVFCKRSKFQEQEIRGAEQATTFYPHVQIPFVLSSGLLLYPFFDGRSESEYRLTYINKGRQDWQYFEIILTTEMDKAEVMLNAYRQSIQIHRKEDVAYEQSIHRFFHARLVKNTRFSEFYGTGVYIHGQLIPLASFLHMPFEVNGASYPCLGEISRNAMNILHPPATTRCPTVFGLGDAHGANIMIPDVPGSDNRRDILYIDYEVAGYHSVMLDLAKPFYTDVFFETLYADAICDPSEIKYTLDEGVIKITMDTCTDRLGREILNIRKRFLIDPLFQHARGMGCMLEEHIPQLAHALFACACLARNFTENWDTLFRNIAVGIALSQVSDLERLWACCSSFGF